MSETSPDTVLSPVSAAAESLPAGQWFMLADGSGHICPACFRANRARIAEDCAELRAGISANFPPRQSPQFAVLATPAGAKDPHSGLITNYPCACEQCGCTAPSVDAFNPDGDGNLTLSSDSEGDTYAEDLALFLESLSLPENREGLRGFILGAEQCGLSPKHPDFEIMRDIGIIRDGVRTLARIVRAKRSAVRARLVGEIVNASRMESDIERMYSHLPRVLKW